VELLFFAEKINHQLIQFELFRETFLEELDSVVFFVFDWDQAWKRSRLGLDSFAQEVKDSHEITEVSKISGNLDL
jgi:hypothetical protein